MSEIIQVAHSELRPRTDADAEEGALLAQVEQQTQHGGCDAVHTA
ncbi:hypothetical protein AB0D57_17435 [Streptomyces sp. NPDC048275]